ncbi:MAG: recombination mediator RecR [Patescibacteria group bacterium]
MQRLPDFIARLVAEFDKLPGIGPKTSLRLAFDLLQRREDLKNFADSLNEAYQKVHFCPRCFNLSDNELCNICQDQKRDQGTVCIIAHHQDIEAIEKTNHYNGTYHLLNGLLSPIDGITPDKLKIKELENRLNKDPIKEVILALDQSLEGEATSLYLTKILKNYPVTVSQLARGIPMGANIEYTDEVTLSSALENRKKL